MIIQSICLRKVQLKNKLVIQVTGNGGWWEMDKMLLRTFVGTARAESADLICRLEAE